MNELGRILQTWSEKKALGQSAVLATVVRVQGSAYRKPGARMLLGDGLDITGSVSGGCLEGDLLRKAWWMVEDGEPKIRRYDSTADADTAWALGIACNGVVDILLERLDAQREPPWLGVLGAAMQERRTVVMGTVLEGFGLGRRFWLDERGDLRSTMQYTRTEQPAEPLDTAALRDLLSGSLHTAVAEIDGISILVEVIRPAARVVIFGAGRDAVPVTELCLGLGWDVTVVDPQTTSAPRGRFHADVHFAVGETDGVVISDDTLAVVMTHNFPTDRTIVRSLLETGARYIGVLGPRARTERMVEGDALRRLAYPIGLDIGADTPEAIALSIVAQLQAVVAGRAADRSKPAASSLSPALG